MVASKAVFASFEQTLVVQTLRQCVEKGGVLSIAGITPGAYAFLAVLLRHLFPGRSIVIVTDTLKTQECVQQDVETWLLIAHGGLQKSNSTPATESAKAFFYPAWEILPHEAKLPHVDIISERLH